MAMHDLLRLTMASGRQFCYDVSSEGEVKTVDDVKHGRLHAIQLSLGDGLRWFCWDGNRWSRATDDEARDIEASPEFK